MPASPGECPGLRNRCCLVVAERAQDGSARRARAARRPSVARDQCRRAATGEKPGLRGLLGSPLGSPLGPDRQAAGIRARCRASDGRAPMLKRRVRASGRPGIGWRRDGAPAGQAPRPPCFAADPHPTAPGSRHPPAGHGRSPSRRRGRPGTARHRRGRPSPPAGRAASSPPSAAPAPDPAAAA
jgi:hypothetical protein